MSSEIERKFLVKEKWREFVDDFPKTLIRQAYIVSTPNLTIRVRSECSFFTETNIAKSSPISVVTIKSGNGPIREETNIVIDNATADALIEKYPRIEKIRRYFSQDDNVTWEVDFFTHPTDLHGFVMAEVELDSLQQEYERPLWIDEEVTWNAEYYNCNLIAEDDEYENLPEECRTRYETFWKRVVENPDGSLNKIQVIKELSDFLGVIDNVPLVYDHVTGGSVSKPNTYAYEVNALHDQYIQDRLEDYKKDLLELVEGVDDLDEIIEIIKRY